MKCSFGISNFLEEISSLSYFIVFPYFFALITEEGFISSPCYSLDKFQQRHLLVIWNEYINLSELSSTICQMEIIIALIPR